MMRQTVLVYRTNISSSGHLDAIRDVFTGNPRVVEWSVDLEDIDKVLRVVCEAPELYDFAAEVRNRGFECEELQ